MRLNRFDLTRYGLFTDFSISFGDRSETMPDFHIIYGANETGKSTLRSAFLDLLFGIERQSVYDFKHPYPTMRIGGLLEIDGAAHDLIRIKKEKNDLLGTDDQPVSEAMLSAVLGSVTRDAYETMFSLDDDTMQQGGDSILQSKGDLGRLLFSAASGLSDLSACLDTIQAEADAFYRPKARNHGLAGAKSRLQAMEKQAKEFDLQASRYAALVKQESSAQARHAAAKAERDANKIRLDHVRRILAARVAWTALKLLRVKLEPLHGIPDLPDGWLGRAQKLSPQAASADSEARLATAQVERLREEHDAPEIDQTILGLKQEIERLSDLDSESRFRTAEEDIPIREKERDIVVSELAVTLGRLGRLPSEDPAALLLPTATEAALNGLIGRRAVIIEADETARDECEKAEARLARSAKRLSDLGRAPDIAHLATLAARLREAGWPKEIAGLKQRTATLRAAEDSALKRLAPWSGDRHALADLLSPKSNQISQWIETLSGLRKTAADLRRALDDRSDDRDRLITEIQAIGKTTGVIDDAAAAAARARRTAAWQAHRAGIERDGMAEFGALNSTADGFENAMAEDDQVAELRLRQSTEVAALREANAGLIRAEAAIEKLDTKVATNGRRLETETAAVGAAMSRLGLSADTDPSELSDWLDRREQALSKGTEYQAALADLDGARDGRAKVVAELDLAMTKAGLVVGAEASFDEKLDAAEAEIERAKLLAGDIRSAGDTLEGAERDREDRDRNAKHTATARRSWDAAWRATLKACWLGEQRSTEEVGGVLHVLRELPVKIAIRDDLDHRIERMAADRLKYVSAVKLLAAKAGSPFEALRALAAADALRNRLADAVRVAKLRDVRQIELDKALAERRGAAEQRRMIKAQFDEMAARYPSADFTDLLEALEKAREKSGYVAQIDDRQNELLESLDCASLDQAQSLLENEASDIDTLKVEETELASLLSDQDDQVSQLFHEHKTAQIALESVSGDADVARIAEQRRTELLDIEDRADRYLQLSIGALAVENALRVFRDRHRSSMMKTAGAAFTTITRNGFTSLTTMPGDDRELLVGLKADGSSLLASQMSKGTRFQLYLALRIAGYGEFVQHREALPFFADDILETFDEDRSAETFELLCDMARLGQVIYLTHTRHLCDIAEQVCGDRVKIHELPEPVSSPPPLLRKA